MSDDWVDDSSYSRDERGKVEPTCWSLTYGRLKLSVHRLHFVPEKWFATAHALGIDRTELGSANLEGAKQDAIDLVIDKAEALHDAARKIDRLHAKSTSPAARERDGESKG